MKTRLSILVGVLCSVACYSQTTAVSDQFGSSPSSASKQPPPSGIFDPLGLISSSQHGQLTTLGKVSVLQKVPRLIDMETCSLLTNPMTEFIDGMPEPVR